MNELHGPVDSTPFRFATPETRFGDGVVAELGTVLDRYGVSNPLIVTDEGIEGAGVLDRAVDTVETSSTIYYASTEPSTTDFDDLPTEAVDGVVAVGGGSCLDTAKLAAVLLAHGDVPADYIGVARVPGPTVPLIAVPTTSGTGSQATQTAVITHEGVKRGVSDEFLRPDVALVDPELSFKLPRAVSARSGFDAFVHALESLLAREYQWVDERPITYQGANPLSRILAWRALRLVHGSLERVVFDGTDRDARRAMSLGSHLAGVAFSASGLGAVHALASTLGGMTDRPHGECLAACVRAGLLYNLPVRRDEYSALAVGLGASDGSATSTAPELLIAECERLRDSIGLPESFEAVGVTKTDVDTVVENTLVQQRRLVTNPRTVNEDLRAFLLAEEFRREPR